jgi:hypothetical protein
MDASDRVIGGELLTSIFGYWPSYHDAEVLWLRLDRTPSEGTYGPVLETLIHTFEITDEIEPNGSYLLKNHVLVHFRFHEVVQLRLDEFNHQNSLFGLSLTDLRERQWEHIQFQVSLDPSFGLGCSFQCHKVEIVSVTPCDRHGVPTGA